jgi:hypothetical protein
MATVVLNPLFTALNGRIGSMVFYTIKGKVYARSYVIPRNPDSVAQRKNRGLFRDAMKAWQLLSSYDKSVFARMARRLDMTGHNLFISRYMLLHRDYDGNRGSEPEVNENIPALSRYFSSFYPAGHSVSDAYMRQIKAFEGSEQGLSPGGRSPAQGFLP